LTDLSLYLHVPFCTEKCDYCDFFSVPTKPNDLIIDRYIDALLKETERRLLEVVRDFKPHPPLSSIRVHPCPCLPSVGECKEIIARRRQEAACTSVDLIVPSLYIGGGTPSLLGAGGIARLLDGIRAIIGALPGGTAGGLGGTNGPCEISVEANPETADSSFLRACADHGVSRLSLGVQSFDQGFREALGRRGEGGAEILSRRLAEAAEIFGRRLSVDLLCGGLPAGDGSAENGSVAKNRVLHDIDKALSYEPGHVSLYALTLEEGTPLAARLAAARQTAAWPGKGEAADDGTSWLAGRDALLHAGFDHYEVSNFALGDENRCIHNIRYWLMNNWIGVGPGASGTIIGSGAVHSGGTGRRTSYAPDVEAFVSGTGSFATALVTEELDRFTVIKETLLMGYRYVNGPDPALFVRRFGKTIEETIPRTLAKWQSGMDDYSFRTKRMLFLNAFLLDAFLELDNTIYT